MGKPGAFEKGPDPRRNTNGRGPSAPATIAKLAKGDREGTFNALVRLRDQAEDEKVQLEAARTLAAYSDGKPTDHAPEKDEPPADGPLTPEEIEALRMPANVLEMKPKGET